jgi:hypothetical protein
LKIKKVLIAWLLGFIIWSLVGSFLFFKPFVSRYFNDFIDTPGLKEWDSPAKFIVFMEIGMFIKSLLWALLFAMIRKSLPGEWLLRGLTFGLIIIMVMVLPRFFYMWMLTKYPNSLLLIDMGSGFIEALLLGSVFAYIMRDR